MKESVKESERGLRERECPCEAQEETGKIELWERGTDDADYTKVWG